jgi:branched-chain amino acid transport system permease protein
MRRAAAVVELLGPLLVVGGAALLGTAVSPSTQTYFVNALVNVAIVVALYLFIGNSGVLSFGHISFVAVGAWFAGVLSVPVTEKPAIMPHLFHFLAHRTVGSVPSLAIAAGVGGVYALVVGLPLMRLSGLAAGIATFGVLEITHNVLQYWEKIGPGVTTFSAVPETTGLAQAGIGAAIAVVVAFAYQRSRFGRLLRATREDVAAARAVGVSVYRQRLVAFALSGAVAGFAGGLIVHTLPITTESVVGALAVSGVDSFLAVAENGTRVAGIHLHFHSGTRIIVVSALMAIVLILRPRGLTGGREVRIARPRWLRAEPPPSDKVPA